MRRRPDSVVPPLAERLARLTARFSAAEIARRAGTSQANVSRYLRGRKFGAEFCASLVEKFGVNPSWLLTGKGAMFLADVASGAPGLAGNLLELIQAMEAVAQLRLGAVAGKSHREVLRTLNDALQRHENLVQELDQRSRPVFRGLLDRIRAALLEGDIERADQLRMAARQVARLCEDESLHRELNGREGYVESQRGNLEAALEFHRRAFVSGWTASPGTAMDVSLHAYNYANLLERTGRLEEGRRVCRSARTLLDDGRTEPARLAMLRMKEARFDLELGDLGAGFGLAIPALGALTADNLRRVFGTCVEALVLSGVLNFEAVAALPEHVGKAAILLRLGRWLGRPDLLRRGAAEHAARPEEGVNRDFDRRVAVWTSGLAAALEGRGRVAFRDLRRTPQEGVPPLIAIEQVVIETEVARLAGNARAAETSLLRAEEAIRGLGDGVTPPLWTRAFHHRNAIRLAGDPARERTVRARAFFADHAARGYRLFGSEMKSEESATHAPGPTA